MLSQHIEFNLFHQRRMWQTGMDRLYIYGNGNFVGLMNFGIKKKILAIDVPLEQLFRLTIIGHWTNQVFNIHWELDNHLTENDYE